MAIVIRRQKRVKSAVFVCLACVCVCVSATAAPAEARGQRAPLTVIKLVGSRFSSLFFSLQHHSIEKQTTHTHTRPSHTRTLTHSLTQRRARKNRKRVAGRKTTIQRPDKDTTRVNERRRLCESTSLATDRQMINKHKRDGGTIRFLRRRPYQIFSLGILKKNNNNNKPPDLVSLILSEPEREKDRQTGRRARTNKTRVKCV